LKAEINLDHAKRSPTPGFQPLEGIDHHRGDDHAREPLVVVRVHAKS
jgi:hypothetical protein